MLQQCSLYRMLPPAFVSLAKWGQGRSKFTSFIRENLVYKNWTDSEIQTSAQYWHIAWIYQIIIHQQRAATDYRCIWTTAIISTLSWQAIWLFPGISPTCISYNQLTQDSYRRLCLLQHCTGPSSPSAPWVMAPLSQSLSQHYISSFSPSPYAPFYVPAQFITSWPTNLNTPRVPWFDSHDFLNHRSRPENLPRCSAPMLSSGTRAISVNLKLGFIPECGVNLSNACCHQTLMLWPGTVHAMSRVWRHSAGA